MKKYKFNALVVSVFLLFTLNGCSGKSSVLSADVAIMNGNVVDGSGKASYVANVAIQDGRIIYIGNDKEINASRFIDAKNLVVSPGFIDGHSHTGEYMVDVENRFNESSITQGITTIVFGADGMYSPKTLKNMLNQYEIQGVGTNVGFYVGHNGIRKDVMGGDQQREPSAYELKAMKAQVDDGMAMGAVGLSSGLMYEPGMYSKTSELVELGKEVTRYGGIYDSHIRDPIRNFIASSLEAIEIGKLSGIATKIAHVKAVCLSNEGLSDDLIEIINNSRNSGHKVVTDQYPYDGAKTDFISSILKIPDYIENNDIKKLLMVPEYKNIIQEASENGINGGFSWIKAVGYDCIRVTRSDDYPDLEGRYISEISKSMGKTGFNLIADLIINAKHDIRVTLGGISENDVRNFMVQPWNMVVSDGKYINSGSSTRQHPRSTGTFTRVLGRYVRDLKDLSLENAIKKMTSDPADFLGFTDRGRVKVGGVADLTIFDKDNISDQSSWSNPLAYSKGIKYVLIGGNVVLNEGVISDNTYGVIVKRSHKTSPFIDLN